MGLFLLLLILITPQRLAAAHSELVSSIPQPGEVLDSPPSRIELTFSEPLADGSSITLYNIEYVHIPGVTYSINPTDRRLMRAEIPSLEPGGYNVQWRSLSLDGHELTGTYSFTVKGSASGRTIPTYLIGILIAVFMLALILIFRRLRLRAVSL